MKKTQKHVVCSLLGSVLLLGSPTISHAAEAATDYNFEEFVVTANRIPVKKTQLAASVTVISSEQIVNSGMSSVPDLLRKHNVDMQRYASATVPVINGDDRVLILVDGRRMNWNHLLVSGNDHAGMMLDSLPVENIERIEIVRGPASSLYGSDAVGGVINIITRQADAATTSVATEFGSWGFQRYNLTTQGKDDSLRYLLTLEKKRQQDFSYKSAATGEIKAHPDSYFDRDSIQLRIDKDFSADRSLTFQYEGNHGKSGFAGYLKPDGSSAYPGGSISSEDNNAALTYQWGTSGAAKNSLRVYRNQNSTTYYHSLSSDSDLTAYGIDWQQNWKLNDSHTLVGGAEWRQEQLNDHASIQRSFTTSALFAENRWTLPSHWSLTLGSRYDQQDRSGGHFTSRITANREIDDHSNLFVSWGQYTKNPTIAQLYNNTQWWKGNAALQPEQGDTFTIGYNTQLANQTKLQLSAYRSQISNAIDWAWKDWDGSGSYYTKYININEQQRQGFDLSLSRQLSPQWTLGAGYSYVSIENKGTSAPSYAPDLRNAQPNSYHLSADYTQDKWNGSLALRRISGRSLSKFSSGSYTTLDLVMNYQMNPATKLFFKGNNLTNAAYETTGSLWSSSSGEYPMPARSFYFGVERKL